MTPVRRMLVLLDGQIALQAGEDLEALISEIVDRH